jgi:hypothetical protein
MWMFLTVNILKDTDTTNQTLVESAVLSFMNFLVIVLSIIHVHKEHIDRLSGSTIYRIKSRPSRLYGTIRSLR